MPCDAAVYDNTPLLPSSVNFCDQCAAAGHMARLRAARLSQALPYDQATTRHVPLHRRSYMKPIWSLHRRWTLYEWNTLLVCWIAVRQMGHDGLLIWFAHASHTHTWKARQDDVVLGRVEAHHAQLRIRGGCGRRRHTAGVELSSRFLEPLCVARKLLLQPHPRRHRRHRRRRLHRLLLSA
jgi:hypothetical protein